MSAMSPVALEASQTAESRPLDFAALRDHMIATVSGTALERDPFCHVYTEGIFPSALYPTVLKNLPAPEAYSPLNPRLYSRKDGKSTRDQFHLTPENLSKLPPDSAVFWAGLVRATTDGGLKRAMFAKLAPDLATRFDMTEAQVPDLDCVYDVVLFRDTEDYRIKPHPDGLNKYVTMQFYLPPDTSTLELGTSLFRHERGLLGGTFHEVERFPFQPNSAYAFAVSDSATRKSWHGREKLTGFTGVRNTLMVLFQRESPRQYAM
jgi:hypothetical protein